MAYLDVTDDNILEDIISRKEFYALKNRHRYVAPQGVAPMYNLGNEIRKGANLQYHSYQTFVQHFINTNTPYNRLLMKHSTGSGKTLGAIGIAMQFIKGFRQEEVSGVDRNTIGSVFIIAFEGAKKAFQHDMIKYPQFGFATRRDLLTWERLRVQALSNVQSDIDKVHDFGNRIKKRITSRRGNGFFRFIGYKALVNRLFGGDGELLSTLSEDEVRARVKDGRLVCNAAFLDSFKNSLVVCDEIHNVYNSLQKNNWGVAIQIVLDHHPTVKAVFMSATPINNNPTEIIDLMNLLLPASNRIVREDFFNKKGLLAPTAIERLRRLSTGRVSYLIDKNPELFPGRSFRGVEIKGIAYLKFVRTQFVPLALLAYTKEFDKERQTLSQDGRYLLDYVLPDPDGGGNGLFRQTDLKKIARADPKWKVNNNIDVVDGVPTGAFLQLDNLGNVSGKYESMVKDLLGIIKGRGGKSMIYHNNVHASGVLFIREVLINNGFVDESMGSTINTLCVVCGVIQGGHGTAQLHKDGHEFKAARFTMVHSDLEKRVVDHNIVMFNRASNAMGDDVAVLIGSRMIKESYDLKAIRHMFIMSRPDNIPMLIQIMGRAVRKNSHEGLPLNMRHVFVGLYTSSLPAGGLSYEEMKYMTKVEDYNTIQKIERIFHENAVDAVVNFATIGPALTEGSDLGDVRFKPYLEQEKKKTVYTPSTLNLGTFGVYYAGEEIDLATYIIKRAFVEVSPVWTYKDLAEFVRAPEFGVDYDTRLIAEESVVIALTKMLWRGGGETMNPLTREGEEEATRLVDKIFDPLDKRMVVAGGGICVVVQVGKYYMRMPLEGGAVKMGIDLPYRGYVSDRPVRVDVLAYMKGAVTGYNYSEKRDSFAKKYGEIPIEQLSEAVCDYGVDFHVRFIEETIAYVFESWTNWSTDKSKFHDFYFKMLYYYDIIGLVVFANTAREYIYREYERYVEVKKAPVAAVGEGVAAARERENVVNLMTRNISKLSCLWCPHVTRELYEKALNHSLERFAIIKVSPLVDGEVVVVKVAPDLLPIGHIMQKVARFYNPKRGWFVSPEYMMVNKTWLENPIIIGYNVKSATGIHVRFKLRSPVQTRVVQSDARLMEKGSMCATKSKEFLTGLCKKLNIVVEEGVSVAKMCSEISARLMYLELLERSNGTNVKFFYTHFEEGAAG